MQLQRIFYHPLRVGDPSLFPYHLQHLAWTFQVVYQTDAFSCKRPKLLWVSCPALLHLPISFEFGRKGRMSHGAPSRSLKLDCQVQVDVTRHLSRHFHNGHSLPPSHHDRSGLRSPPCDSRHPHRGAEIQGEVVNLLYSGCLSRHEPLLPSEIIPGQVSSDILPRVGDLNARGNLTAVN